MSSPSFTAALWPQDAIELGRVLDPWGVKGWVRLHPHSADTSALLHARTWYLQPPEERFAIGFTAFEGSVSVRVLDIKLHSGGVVAQLEGVQDRNAALALKGVRISVPRSAFPAAAEGEYYWVDLIGLNVVNREGVHLGVVCDLMPTGPNSVLVMEYPQTVDGAEVKLQRLIPFVSAYVDEVNLSGRCIKVDWGLDY